MIENLILGAKTDIPRELYRVIERTIEKHNKLVFENFSFYPVEDLSVVNDNEAPADNIAVVETALPLTKEYIALAPPDVVGNLISMALKVDLEFLVEKAQQGQKLTLDSAGVFILGVDTYGIKGLRRYYRDENMDSAHRDANSPDTGLEVRTSETSFK